MNKNIQDLFIAIIILAFCGWMYMESLSYQEEIRTFPVIALIIMSVMAIFILFKVLLKVTKKGQEETAYFNNTPWKTVVIILGLWIITVWIIPSLGYYITIAIFSFVALYYVSKHQTGKGGVVQSLLFTVSLTVLLFFVFRIGLDVPI